jgi:heat-inducible transcriptional repressor
MLQSPEFSDQSAAQQVVEIFENPIILGPFLTEARQMPGVQVILGGENPYENLPDVSLVLSRYGRPSYGAGVVGVVGPLRMPYAQTISAVRFISQLMTGLLSELYGYPESPAEGSRRRCHRIRRMDSVQSPKISRYEKPCPLFCKDRLL